MRLSLGNPRITFFAKDKQGLTQLIFKNLPFSYYKNILWGTISIPFIIINII